MDELDPILTNNSSFNWEKVNNAFAWWGVDARRWTKIFLQDTSGHIVVATLPVLALARRYDTILFCLFSTIKVTALWLWLSFLKKIFKHTTVLCWTRELPGVALVNISTWPIFMGKGNTLFREICITLPGRVRRIERHRLSGYQSLGLRKHLDEPQTKDSHIS